MERRTFLKGVAASGLLSSAAAPAGLARAATFGPQGIVINGSDSSELNMRYIKMHLEAGVHCIVTNPFSRSPMGGLGFFSKLYNFLDSHGDMALLAKSAADIVRARKENKVAIVAGWQDAEALTYEPKNWAHTPLQTGVRAYYELGLRSCGICYNLSNIFGGGCLDAHVGLTKAGRHLVEELHRFGIIVDIGGHTGEQTSLDIADMSAGVPVICSHTNPKTLVDNPRNTSDRVLDAIARTDGVVGITAINDFLARGRHLKDQISIEQTGVDTFVTHVDYVKKRIGVDHVAIGPDFTESPPPYKGGMIDPATSFIFPPEMASRQGPVVYARGFERITELKNVAAGLAARGWTTDEINKVMGGNWLRVFSMVWRR